MVLCAAAVAAIVGYVYWRGFHTLDANLWLAIPLFVAEIVVLGRFLLSLAAIGPRPGAGVSTPARAATEAQESSEGRNRPPVEVLVVASDADVEALGRTLSLASVDRPVWVRVLDHSERRELEAETQRHGGTYEVFPGASPAGMLNAAMQTSSAPIVAWLDAGDVPVPGLLGLAEAFDDPDLAVIQCATDLVNRDSLLHLTPDHDERALANAVAGPSLDRAGAAPWEGSGSLIRVSAMEHVGWMPEGDGSATHRASMRLLRAGLSIRFCAERLVRTVAPDSLTEYLAEEERSTRGDWALLGTSDTPLRFGAGLRGTLTQLHRSTTALDGLARFTFLAVLTAVLLSGALPFSSPLVVAAAFVGVFALRTIALRSLAMGTVALGDTTRQSLRLMGARISALVSSAPAVGGAESRRWAALGQLPLLSASLVVIDIALALRLLTLIWPDLLPPLDSGARFVAMAAAVWTVLAVLDVLHVLVSRVQRRLHHRQGTELVVQVDGESCRSVDLTPVGVGVLLPASLVATHEGMVGAGTKVAIHLDIPRLDGTTTPVDLLAHLEHVAPVPVDGFHRAGAAFASIPPEGRDALVEFCALTAEHRDRVQRPVLEAAPDDFEVASHGPGRRALAMLSTAGLLVAGPFVLLGPDAGAAEVDPRTATISGQVTDGNGNPVRDACVGLWNDGEVPWEFTDDNGNYQLTSVAGGDQIVAVQDCSGGGYMPTFNGPTPFAGRATPVPVPTAEAVEGVDITVVAGVEVTGRVLDQDGSPASEVCVNYGPPDGEPGTDQMWLGFTDDEGRFWGRLPAGEGVRIQMNDCGAQPRFVTSWYPGTSDAAKAEIVKAPAGDQYDLGDSVMQPGAIVTGTVVDPSGNGLGSVCVSAQDVRPDSWNWVGGTNTDKAGNYRFMVPAGTYSLWFSDCGESRDYLEAWYPDSSSWTDAPPTVDIADGENRFDMTMTPGAVVTGTVSDDAGVRRENVCVGAVRVSEHNWDWVAGANTDRDGNYRILAPEGDFSLVASPCDDGSELIEEFHDGSPTWTRSAPTVSLRAGPNDQRDFFLDRGGFIEGTVVSTDGTPAGNVCVSATDAESLRNDDWQSSGWARSNDDGTWRTRAVPVGEYTVHYSNCDTNGDWSEDGIWVPEFHGDVLEPLVRDLDEIATFEVKVGANPALQADLLRAARVKGQVTSGGAPAAEVCVNTPLGRQVSTDDQGYYSVGLVPGSSRLTFSDCQPGRGLVQAVHDVDLAEGEGVVHDLAMQKAAPASITGSVRTASDGVLQPSCVVAYVPDDLIGVAMVDPAGNFEIAGMGAGSYWVGVFGCADDPDIPMVDPDTGAEYPASWYPGVPIGFPKEGAPDPAADGASPVTLSAGQATEASFCFGGCVDEVVGNPTTTAPTTVPPSTTVPSTTVPSSTVPGEVPTTTAAPTTAAPTTAAPPSAPVTTAPPVTAPAGGSVSTPAMPAPESWGPYDGGSAGVAPPAAGSTVSSAALGSRPAVEGPVVAASVATAEEIRYAPEAVVSAGNSELAVQDAETASARQVPFDSNDEVAAVTPLEVADGGTDAWLWWAAIALLLAVAGGLFVVRRRLD